MGRSLVLVGAGHAHMTCLLRLGQYVARGHKVTVVSRSPYQYYSGMGPGMLSGMYEPRQCRFHVRKMTQDRGGAFVEGEVLRVDAPKRRLILADSSCVRYDAVSFNTGSSVPTEGLLRSPQQNVFAVKPVTNLLAARAWAHRLAAETGDVAVLVVGGGAAGVETAANAFRLVCTAGARARVLLLAAGRLLKAWPERARSLALASLMRRGIQVQEHARAAELKDGEALLEDGRRAHYDMAFIAVGVRPSALFERSGLPTGPAGGLLVDGRLQCVAHERMFGGGDCISLKDHDLARVGVHAVRQNPILFHNLMAALEGDELETFHPDSRYMLILNTADRRGIAAKRGPAWDGPFAFLLKDHIDRSFMHRFQVSGELG